MPADRSSVIAIAGLWHQGCVLAACLADLGHQVRGIADDAAAARALTAGEPPVHEPKLGALMRRNLRAGRLSFTTDFRAALAGAEFAYLAIDTPVDQADRPELASVFDAARRIGDAASGPITVIVTAQVPVGTSDKLAAAIRGSSGPPQNVDVCYVPEFLRLGAAVDTFRRADRFVIGADDPAVAYRVARIYRPLGRPLVITSLRTAEMAKHASNAFLATSVSFINEIADLCDETGADAAEVAQIMKLDRRIGRFAFLSPGLGFAGGTLGRDVRTLQSLGVAHARDTRMMDAVMAVNEARAGAVLTRLKSVYPHLEGTRIGVLGLTYKAGTSTLRRSIAIEIIRALVASGASVSAFDPLARFDERISLPEFERCDDPLGAAEGSDALLLVTEWAGIEGLDLESVRAAMRRPIFIDSRNLLRPEALEKAGFTYFGIGRGQRNPAPSSSHT